MEKTKALRGSVGHSVALGHWAQKAGVSLRGMQVLPSASSNSVIRLSDAELIVRVNEDVKRANKAVAFARWLKSNGIPAVDLVEGVRQPIAVDGFYLTLWKDAGPDVDAWASNATLLHKSKLLGTALKSLHRNALSIQLEPWAPLGRCDAQIESASGLRDAQKSFLKSRVSKVQRHLEQAPTQTPIHGDAHPGNILMDGRLCDFDTAAAGPAEADLAYAQVVDRHFGPLANSTASALLSAYGEDLDRALMELCTEIHELRAVCGLLPSLDNPAVRAEFEVRAESLTGSSTVWKTTQELTEAASAAGSFAR